MSERDDFAGRISVSSRAIGMGSVCGHISTDAGRTACGSALEADAAPPIHIFVLLSVLCMARWMYGSRP